MAMRTLRIRACTCALAFCEASPVLICSLAHPHERQRADTHYQAPTDGTDVVGSTEHLVFLCCVLAANTATRLRRSLRGTP
eukprot:2098657-Pleurochrysis_carterae.AAC.3